MADPATPSPWPGTYAAPAVIKSMVAQGVKTGTTPAPFGTSINEIAQVEKGLVWFNPSIAPFLRILTKLKNPRSVENARFYHMERQRLPRASKVVGAGIVGGATSPTAIRVTATHGTRFRVNDLVYNITTGDVARITAISTDDLTVTTNIGNGSPSGTLWANDNDVVNMGNAYLDGSASGSPLSVVEDEKLFYTQIFKDAIEISDRYDKTALYEGDAWTNLRKTAEFEHTLSIEHAMFLGKASVSRDAATGKLLTTMAGLKSLVNVNLVDTSGGTPSKAWLDTILTESMRQGHSGYENKELANKTAFASVRWQNKLNQIAEAQIRIVEPSQDTFGLRIKQYQGAWGNLNIVNTPVLNNVLPGDMYVLDLEHLRPALFKGRDTRFEGSIGDNDVDGKKGQYISDKGLIAEVIPAHTQFFGLA